MKAIDWGGEYATDKRFLQIVRNWLQEDGEVFVDYYFPHSGGLTYYGLFDSFGDFLDSVNSMNAHCVIQVYRSIRFTIRGLVDDDFIKYVLSIIQEGTGWFFISYDSQETTGVTKDAYGDSRLEILRQELIEHHQKYILLTPVDHWLFPPADYPGEWITSKLSTHLL